MKKVTMKDIERYWEDGDYMKLVGMNMDDFCRMWAEEEGIVLPETFSVGEHNSRFFQKINSQKHTVNLISGRMGYSIVETESLTMDFEYALKRAVELFRQHGGGVIRANEEAGGGGTYVIKNEKSIPQMLKNILFHQKRSIISKEGIVTHRNIVPILPLFSPFYYAPVEYGVFIIKGKVVLCIAKKLNKLTGLHNLTLGAKADVVTDLKVIKELENVCEGLSDIFNFGFARIDVMATEEGLKIVELSVPNFKKFSLQDRECMALSKQMFLKYHETFYL